MRRAALAIVFLCYVPAVAQITATLDVQAHKDNAGVSAATVVVGPITPKAGDGITCEVSFYGGETFTSVADNVNSGSYSAGIAVHKNTAFDQYVGLYYKSGVSGSATTITLTFSKAHTYAAMSCQAWKPSSTATLTLDSSFTQQQDSSGANPITGTARMPSNANEIVIGNLQTDITTPSAPGTNFTWTNVNGSTTLFPEYWIQTTATSTNAGQTNAADSWDGPDGRVLFCRIFYWRYRSQSDFQPPAGIYSNTQTVTITSATSGATICYTTNGTTPAATTAGTCSTGTALANGGSITVPAVETVQALGTLSGYTNSSVASAAYAFTSGNPTISLAAGTYTTGLPRTTTITSSTTGATICYTINGSTPAAATSGTCSVGTTLTNGGTVTLSPGLYTLQALATLSGYTNSSVMTAAYTFTPTWASWNGVTVGGASGNISRLAGVSIGTNTGNYNSWNGIYSGAVSVPAALTTPAPGSTLAGSSVTFSWTPGSGATAYTLYLGTTGVGSSNVYNSGQMTATSASVTGIPTNGATLYAQLGAEVKGAWQYYNYTYTEEAPAALTTPAPGSTLAGSSVTFSWTPDSGATAYTLYLGTTGAGSSNVYNSGQTTATSASVTGIPTNGATLYAQLGAEVNGAWQYYNYTYIEAASSSSLSPALISVVQTGTDNAYNVGANTNQTAPGLIVNLVTPFQGGPNNCAVMMVTADSGLTQQTPTDNESETWTEITSVGQVVLWGIHGTTAGTNQITITTTGTATSSSALGATVAEVYNCSGFGGSGTLNTAATGSALSLTLSSAPNSGDMTWAAFFDTTQLDDTSAVLDSTITPGTGFTNLTNSLYYGKMSEYSTTNTSTTVQVTYSGRDTINGAAVVIKQGPAGTGPPGTKYVDTVQAEGYGLQGGAASHATNFPCRGNLIIGLMTNGSAAGLTSITSSGTSATWNTGETNTLTFGAEVFYGANATCSSNGTITPSFAAAQYVQIDYYSVSNASSSPFDKGVNTSYGEQTTDANLTTDTITPTNSGELVCNVAPIDFHTITGTVADANGHTPIGPSAVATSDDDASSGTYYTPASSLESDDGRSCFISSDTNEITFTYTMSENLYGYAPTGVQWWDSATAAFK